MHTSTMKCKNYSASCFTMLHTSISVTSFSLPLVDPKLEPSANVDFEPTYTWNKYIFYD